MTIERGTPEHERIMQALREANATVVERRELGRFLDTCDDDAVDPDFILRWLGAYRAAAPMASPPVRCPDPVDPLQEVADGLRRLLTTVERLRAIR